MARKQPPNQADGDKRREIALRRPKKPAWKPIFLAELEKWGVVDHAVKVAGVAPSTVYAARQRDPEFAEAWDQAERRIVALAEVIARQRAIQGTKKPVYFQGKQIDSITEVDNAHLRWLLSKLKPEVYGDKVEVNQNVKGSLDVNVAGGIDITLLTDDELDHLEELYSRAESRSSTNGAGKT